MDGIRGKRILVTGGTGSIGSALVEACLEAGAAHVTVFSRDDSKHFYLQRRLAGSPTSFLIGDVRDAASLGRAFEDPVDIVLHAAALKHVAVCEHNPTEAVQTNVVGTQRVIDAAKAHGAARFVLVSTDKAVDPSCTMGATKYLAEKLTLGSDRSAARGMACVCVRFGNVLGTRGSVVPAMFQAIQDHGRIQVSDPDVTRFAIHVDDAARLVLAAATRSGGGVTYVLPMRAFRLGDIVEAFARQHEFAVDAVGLADFEKMHEGLIGNHERGRTTLSDDLLVIHPPGADVRVENVVPDSATAPRFTVDELADFIAGWRGRMRDVA